MIDPTVRRADPQRPDDLVQLADLEVEARAALVDQRGGNRWLVEHPAVGDGWGRRCQDGDVHVAVIDDVIVGYLVADLGTDRVIRIDQVWVTPEARELGFGDELLAAAIASGRARGAEAVEGQALPGDRHTKNLYERAGIVARLITTYRRL
ncbi:MAG TPA: GNAT family N-acetyltransferase [Ilumatobacteraceae bacterium]|nr:GNAT family N-acetyltransferase [Ilumatobacteraceae bacterium]